MQQNLSFGDIYTLCRNLIPLSVGFYQIKGSVRVITQNMYPHFYENKIHSIKNINGTLVILLDHELISTSYSFYAYVVSLRALLSEILSEPPVKEPAYKKKNKQEKAYKAIKDHLASIEQIIYDVSRET